MLVCSPQELHATSRVISQAAAAICCKDRLRVQEDNVTQADTQHDPFIEGYRAWLQQNQFASATGTDFLASFSNTSGAHSILYITP